MKVNGTAVIISKSFIVNFTVIFLSYLLVNLGFRWLRWGLFHGHGAFGWEEPSFSLMLIMIGSIILSSVVFVIILYYIFRVLVLNISKPIFLVVLFLLSLVIIIIIELDLGWFSISKNHITFRDAQMFFLGDWENHFGIQDSDVDIFLGMLFVHSAAILIMMLMAGLLTRFLSHQRFYFLGEFLNSKKKVLVGVVLIMYALDQVLIGVMVGDKYTQLEYVSYQNPLRANVAGSFLKTNDLKEINAAFRKYTGHVRLSHDVLKKSDDEFAGRFENYNVLMVVVEGLNPNFINQETMPFFSSLHKNAITNDQHYSTGNSTHLGVLGAIFGKPVTFFDGRGNISNKKSKYLDLLAENNYESKMISADLSIQNHAGNYFSNFSLPSFENRDNWSLIGAIDESLIESKKSFLYVHYYGTHYPYKSSQNYQKFQPSLPKNFDFSRWDLAEYHESIINSYRNTLVEFDEWLKLLSKTVDLNKTILVVTGDHGEEFFEHGRLGHASTLETPQIRTFISISTPSLEGVELSRLSSHIDIMTTLMRFLGIEGKGEELSYPLHLYRKNNFAVVGYNNHIGPVYKWVIVTENYRTYFEQQNAELIITRISNAKGEKIDFVGFNDEWELAFSVANLSIKKEM